MPQVKRPAVAEQLAILKTARGRELPRGFESHALRSRGLFRHLTCIDALSDCL
jgi:hypothetical protein